ncbi:MAG: hypothetical protein GY707_04990 [Desulfobacteraceae bacterium]|nr:hypothetical protein [Desulfobacteraceae bacterium]
MRKWIGENESIISSIAVMGQMLAVVFGIAIATFEFSIKDRIAERNKIETTQKLMESSWELHREVIEDISHYNAMTKIELSETSIPERIYKKQKDIFFFYSKLELCIDAELCNERTARKLFCDYAIIEAKRYYDSAFLYDDELGYFGKHDRTPLIDYDLALFRFVTKCDDCSDSQQGGGEPKELKEYKKWARK